MEEDDEVLESALERRWDCDDVGAGAATAAETAAAAASCSLECRRSARRRRELSGLRRRGSRIMLDFAKTAFSNSFTVHSFDTRYDDVCVHTRYAITVQSDEMRFRVVDGIVQSS